MSIIKIGNLFAYTYTNLFPTALENDEIWVVAAAAWSESNWKITDRLAESCMHAGQW